MSVPVKRGDNRNTGLLINQWPVKVDLPSTAVVAFTKKIASLKSQLDTNHSWVSDKDNNTLLEGADRAENTDGNKDTINCLQKNLI